MLWCWTGKYPNYVDILQGVAQGCALLPNQFKVYINDMIVAVEAASKKSRWGKEDTVSGLMFAGDSVGLLETPEGLQKQIRESIGVH